MNIGIIGAGLIGTKRGLVIKKSKTDTVKCVADLDIEKANKLAGLLGCRSTKDLSDITDDPAIDVVIISTTHDQLARISKICLKKEKHVLCEKPLGIAVREIDACVKLAKKNRLVYKPGYNHRFHPSLLKANTMFNKGKIGKLMYLKSTYGIGGRPGYEKEWRMDKSKSGGGELIDQGTHLLDLARWFMGNITTHKSELITGFWPIKPLEDNVFLLLKNKHGAVAELHASWTEWKNRFVFEIYGTTGYLKVNGLGGSYGVETLTWGKRIPGKAPKEKTWEYPQEDNSWKKEWRNFTESIRSGKEPLGSGKDGLEVMRIISDVYRKNL